MVKALLFEKRDNLNVKCQLCAHRCLINNGKRGKCGVRKNVRGELFSLNSDKVAACHLDPIEKKPLYHFLPGSQSFSLASFGCNFTCEFCQNYSLSQVKKENEIVGAHLSDEEIIAEAIKFSAKSISYTYSEPTVFFELMLATAKLAKLQGLKNVMVTNGYMTSEALEMIAPYLDAANIDLKSFSDEFYKKKCGARLEPVLHTIQDMKRLGIWVELTTLLIPSLNSEKKEMDNLIDFILAIDPNMPWHVSRFYPQYRMQYIPATLSDSIFQVLEMGQRKGLKYVYSGNVNNTTFMDTLCPVCGKVLIQRRGYSTTIMGLAEHQCSNCGLLIPGHWD